MSDTDSEIPKLIDKCIKRLFRDQSHAVLRLVGAAAVRVSFEDSNININIPELSADQVFIVEEGGNANPFAIYLEYQLQPDNRVLNEWGLKWLGLCHRLSMEVVLLVIYLIRFAAQGSRRVDGVGGVIGVSHVWGKGIERSFSGGVRDVRLDGDLEGVVSAER